MQRCKGFSHFFNKNSSVFAILPFAMQMILTFFQQKCSSVFVILPFEILTNRQLPGKDIIHFEQLAPDFCVTSFENLQFECL